MTTTYSAKLATRYGINAALVAAYIHEGLKAEGRLHHKQLWFRCSQKRMTAVYPFYGVGAVAYALKRLTDNGVLLKHEYNDSRFDRTLSYAFTDYGKELMEEE